MVPPGTAVVRSLKISPPLPWVGCHEHDWDQKRADASGTVAPARGPFAGADQFTGAMGRKLREALGIDASQLAQRLDNHLLRVDIGHTTRLSDDGKVGFDWWGAGGTRRPRATGTPSRPWRPPGTWTAFLARPRWSWPAGEAATAIAADGGEHFVAPNFGMCLFERAWSLRGFTAFLMDLVDDPGWADELLDRITDIQVRLARRFVALGIDGGYLGDDYGAQRGMLFSPRLWRQLFKPRLAGSSPSSAGPDCR